MPYRGLEQSEGRRVLENAADEQHAHIVQDGVQRMKESERIEPLIALKRTFNDEIKYQIQVNKITFSRKNRRCPVFYATDSSFEYFHTSLYEFCRNRFSNFKT